MLAEGEEILNNQMAENCVRLERSRRACVICVVGARPNFMKIMPLMRAFARRTDVFDIKLVHTGQHYDVEMNSLFFGQLGIPSPDVSLEVGSGSHAVQTAEIMKRFEPVVDSHAPDAVLVVGDVNSTIACSLVAAKKGVRVIHVEAGLRSGDRGMPEEINRILTDQLSDRLYVTEDEAISNLLAEGVSPDKIVHAGNVMIDTLLACRDKAVSAVETLKHLLGDAAPVWLDQGYGVLTLHRPSNVDDPETMRRLLHAIARMSKRLPIVFPMHPRTSARINEFGLAELLEQSRVAVLGPQGYLEMLGLLDGARLLLTDSGGLQEESTALGLPCLTLRDNTERPVTVREGTNVLVGTDTAAIESAFEVALACGRGAERRPRNWDGHAAERIVEDLAGWLRH